MKPVNKEQRLRAEGFNGKDTPTVHKPDNGQGQNPGPIVPKKPNNNKKKKLNKNKSTRKPKGKKQNSSLSKYAKIGGGAAVALVGVSGIGIIASHHNNSKPVETNNSGDKSNSNSGFDDYTPDDNSKSHKSEKKHKKSRNDEASSKSSKSTNTLNDLLGSNDSDHSSGGHSDGSHHSNSKSSDDTLDDLLAQTDKSKNKKVSDGELDKLAAKASESKSKAESLVNKNDNKDKSSDSNQGSGSDSSKPTSGRGEQPGKPTQPTQGGGEQPSKPTQPTQGGGEQPSKPTQPTQGGGEQPSKPTQPSQGSGDQPGQPTQPSQGSGDQPGQPTQPSQGSGDQPGQPTQPSQGSGDQPSQPSQPSQGSQGSDDKPTTPTYPFESVPDGTTKQVTLVTQDGKEVGTATLTKSGNSVNITDIPGGYKVADRNDLLQWPDKITVVSDGTSQPSTPSYPFESVPDGTTKQVTLVTQDGKQVGTATLFKSGNGVNINDMPGGYQIADKNDLLQWPDKITVVSDGTSQPTQPSTPSYPFESVPDGTTKEVTLVTQDGKQVGTAVIEKNSDGVSIDKKPLGVELVNKNDLLQWPDQLTVSGEVESQPTYPSESVPSGTSKTVKLVNTNGQVIGNATISKNGNTVNINGIPDGYQLANRGDLLQWPNQLTVVGEGNTGNTTTNEQKTIKYLDSNGKEVGTGTIWIKDGHIGIDGIPGGYKLADPNGYANYPDSVVVVPTNK